MRDVQVFTASTLSAVRLGLAATLCAANRFRRAEAAPPAGARRAKRRDEVRMLRRRPDVKRSCRCVTGTSGLPVGSLQRDAFRPRGSTSNCPENHSSAAARGGCFQIPPRAQATGALSQADPDVAVDAALLDLRPPRRRGAERGVEAVSHSVGFPAALHAQPDPVIYKLGRVRAESSGATLERPGARSVAVSGRGDPPQDGRTHVFRTRVWCSCERARDRGLGLSDKPDRLILSEPGWRVVNLT